MFVTQFSSTTSSAPTIPIHHAVTILLWRAQLLPFLRSMKLMGYIDGSTPPPSILVPASTAPDAALVPNPEYARWYD
jgi:hypothetical protein